MYLIALSVNRLRMSLEGPDGGAGAAHSSEGQAEGGAATAAARHRVRSAFK